MFRVNLTFVWKEWTLVKPVLCMYVVMSVADRDNNDLLFETTSRNFTLLIDINLMAREKLSLVEVARSLRGK